MAECCSRCAQEKRLYRKELTRWGKNVLILAGMERVAQELMGGRKWRKLMTPFNSLEEREPKDWSQHDTCYFCNSKSPNSTETVVRNADIDNSLHSPVQLCSHCKGLTSNSTCTCKSRKSPSSIDQPLDLSVHSRRYKFAETPHSDDASDLGDNDHSLIKVPQPSSTAKTNKRNRLQTNSVWKRTYTEEELQAALRDIQSGKLGTRRAAVIYGIPRSTLRNKVYKLALDRDRSNGKRKINSGDTSTRTLIANNKKTNNSDESLAARESRESEDTNHANFASESLKQLLKNTITQRTNNNNNSVSNVTNTERTHSLLSADSASQLQSQFNLNDMYNNEALAAIQMLSTIDVSLAPLFTQFLLMNIHQLAFAKHHSGESYGDVSNVMSGNVPILPELIRKLASDRLVEETSNQQHSNRDNNDGVNENLKSNVILKVPSFKPKTKTSSTLSSSEESKQQQLSVTNSDNDPVNQCITSSSSQLESDDIESKSFSLKEIIAKSISQRFPNTCTKTSNNCVTVSEDSSSDALNNDDKLNSSANSGGDGKNSGNVSDQSDPSTPEKRNRPKRGRYRNYNRDDLAKAVRAVQRGEMSVHRAGTLFGVPHSTLEYKVKERHLLRPKKRHHDSTVVSKKETAPKTSATHERSINGTSTSGAPPTDAATVTNNSSVHLPFWHAAFPFFPVELGSSTNSTNFFASNMMRRLQENARLNQDQSKSQANNEYGGLLLESLIKSSLDSNSTPKSKSNTNNDDDVLNSSLAVLKEMSALDKKD